MASFRRVQGIGRASDIIEQGSAMQRRETVASAGRVLSKGIGQLYPKHGELVLANTSSGDVDVFLPKSSNLRNADKVTIVNDGKNTVYVHAPDGASIHGWPCYPLLARSGATIFVQAKNNLYVVIGRRQQPSWPVFTRTSSTVVTASRGAGKSGPLAVYMNDGRMLLAASGITCTPDNTGIGGRISGESVTTGLWHIFAVPTGPTTFGLTASKAATPTTGGPTGYTVYRYLWTIRIDSTGPTVIENFMQSDNWYVTADRDKSANQLVTVSTALPTNNTWNQVDGTNLAGAGTTSNVYAVVPSGIASQILLNHTVVTASTTAQTGHVYCGPGTTGSPPYTLTTNQRARSAHATTGSGAGYTSPSDGQANEEVCPISTTGLVVSFQGFGANYIYTMTHRGYLNSMWGND